MAEQTVKCPRCGQMVAVPTTGEKVYCTGCGQKFRYETPKAVAISPVPAAPPPEPPPPLETRDVQCPDCGKVVRVPVSGERAFCACGRKFRLDVGERPAELPLPSDPDAPLPVLPSLLLGQDVRCPDCGKVLHVTAMAEKVRCPCGRKFWLDALADRRGGGEHPTEDALEVKALGDEAPVASPLSLSGRGQGEGRAAASPSPFPLPGREGGGADEAPTPPPMPAPAAAPATREVTCPDCGKAVQVPLNGEKVYCTCGRKFRCEAPAAKGPAGEGEAPAEPPLPRGAAQQELRPPEPRRPAEEPLEVEVLGDEAPTPPPPMPAPAAAPAAANQVRCPRCGAMVQVPLSGEKVRCPGCGQKFRFEAPAASPSPFPLPGREGGGAAAGVPGIAAPSAVLAAAAVALPPPTATPAAAEELRGLWAWLRETIHRAYEGGRADDEARVAFRQKADRAAALASVFLGAPGPASSGGHVFVTSVLPEMALDEILHLSVEDYRHLDESLDDVQRQLDARVPLAPAPPPSPAFPFPRPAAAAPPAQAQVPAPRRRRGLTTFEAAAAILSVAALAAAIVFFPEIKDFVARLQSRGDAKPKTSVFVAPRTETVLVPEPPKVATRSRPLPRKKTPDVSTDVPPVKIPDFITPPPKVETSVPVPPDKEKEKGEPEPPLPKDKAEPPEPESPWAKLGPGVHRLFNGTDLKGWAQSGAWAVRGGEAHARAPVGPVAAAIAGNPEWSDYTVQVRARVIRADRVTREGEYYLVILRYQDPQNFMCVRFPIEGIYEIGYYRDGAFHEVGRARHGLAARFNQFHTIEVGVSGNKISVVIDNIRTGAPPWTVRGLDRGPCGIGVTGGEAAFEDLRVRVER